MKYRKLGASGLRVSVLTMGTATFGGTGRYARLGRTDRAGARRQIDICLDHGVNMVDTANTYSGGAAEEFVGAALSGRRERVLLATKVGATVGDGPNEGGASRLHILRELDKSLRRLATDHIDLYQLHGWDGTTPLDETLDALSIAMTQGKIRYVGASNFAGWQLVKMLTVAHINHRPGPISHQLYYSLQCRDADTELFPAATDLGLGNLIWSPLAGGLLTGKYRRDAVPPVGARHATPWDEPPVRDWERLYDVIDVLVEIGRERKASAAQVALAWLLSREDVTSVVIGARTDEQLQANLASVDVRLTADDVGRLERMTRPDLPYPHWHMLQNASDRLGPGEGSFLAHYMSSELADSKPRQ